MSHSTAISVPDYQSRSVAGLRRSLYANPPLLAVARSQASERKRLKLIALIASGLQTPQSQAKAGSNEFTPR